MVLKIPMVLRSIKRRTDNSQEKKTKRQAMVTIKKQNGNSKIEQHETHQKQE
jgi:hypothetical protein